MTPLFANINPFLQNRFLLLNHSNQTQAEEDNSPIGWSELLGGVSLSLWYTCYDNCCCPSPSAVQLWGLTPSQPGNPLVHSMHSILQPVGMWDTRKRTNPQCICQYIVHIVITWVNVSIAGLHWRQLAARSWVCRLMMRSFWWLIMEERGSTGCQTRRAEGWWNFLPPSFAEELDWISTAKRVITFH